MPLPQRALEMLQLTSRTFVLPIIRLPGELQEAVGAAYLCMRAIDEIEDHPLLDGREKVELLRGVSRVLQAQTAVESFAHDDLAAVLASPRQPLPEVTLQLGEWACLVPPFIAPRVWEAVGATAERMAGWVASGWRVQTEADLDRYTYSVAGAVGLLLCDLLAWYDGVQIDRAQAIRFGRGLQAVNVLRNRAEDLERGVDYFPTGWAPEQVQAYARRNLATAEAYARTLPGNAFEYLFKIPLALAYATLDALAGGEMKLSRATVLELVRQFDAE